MKQITIIIEDKLGTILSSKSLCDSSLELIRNNDNELTVIIKSDEFLITDWRTNVLPSDPIELPSDEEIDRESEVLYPINKGGSMWMPSRYDIDKSNRQEGFVDGAKWMRDKTQGGNRC